jgi:hypothetical protein
MPPPAVYFKALKFKTINEIFHRSRFLSPENTREGVMLKKMFFVLLSGMLVLMSGCSTIGRNDKNFTLSPEAKAAFADLTPDAAIAQYAGLLQTAQQEELGYYSPQHLARAQGLIADAEKMLIKKASANEIFTTLALCRKHLDEGYQVKGIAQQQLAGVTDEKTYLDALNANVLYPGDYADVTSTISSIIKDIEEGKLPRAQENTGKLLAKMQEMEIRATLDIVLGHAKTTWATLKAKDFPEIAPQTCLEAETAISTAELTIRNNVRDKVLVAQAGRQAEFAASRALAVGEEILRLQKIKSKAWELEVISGERRLQNFGQVMGCPDVRDRSLDAQSDAIARCAAENLAKQVAAAETSGRDLALQEIAAQEAAAWEAAAKETAAREAAAQEAAAQEAAAQEAAAQEAAAQEAAAQEAADKDIATPESVPQEVAPQPSAPEEAPPKIAVQQSAPEAVAVKPAE